MTCSVTWHRPAKPGSTEYQESSATTAALGDWQINCTSTGYTLDGEGSQHASPVQRTYPFEQEAALYNRDFIRPNNRVMAARVVQGRARTPCSRMLPSVLAEFSIP